MSPPRADAVEFARERERERERGMVGSYTSHFYYICRFIGAPACRVFPDHT